MPFQETIEIKFPSGKVKSFPKGVQVKEIIKDEEYSRFKYPVIAAAVNNSIKSLNYRLEIASSVNAITTDTRDGAGIYRRSLCFLLAKTSRQVFPDRRLIISHSIGKGFYYYYDGMDKIPDEDLVLLKNKMHEIAEADYPIDRKVLAYKDAVAYFKETGQKDTVLLLQYRNEARIYTTACGSYMDLYHGPLVCSTGILKTFDIVNYSPGFVLQYFSHTNPEGIEPFKKDPVLFSIYQEYKNWGKILNAHCVGALNDIITKGDVKEFIEINEALQNKKIASIADKIAGNINSVKLVLIAGPSSSGKTTFAKKLSIQLKVLGIQPVSISVDNYFVDRDKTPLDEEGKHDLESIQAIDTGLLNDHLIRLFDGQEVKVPLYDFKSGKRKEPGTPLKLPQKAVLIVEGIHCLNDALTERIDRSLKYKIYVSALTQVNIDDHNRISTTDNRLIRRMVRDNKFRGHSACDTLRMWPSVRRGEDRNIFPFQNSVDSAFNSALDYELAVLMVYAEPLLKTVNPDLDVYSDAKKLLIFLNNFVPIPSSGVPLDSILREFIGEGSFKY